MTAHSDHRRHHSSHASSFLFGVLMMIVALAAIVTWFEVGDLRIRTAEMRPAITVPMPEIPTPPGVVPNSGRAN